MSDRPKEGEKRLPEDYDSDILLWSERQADALRRRAANELDWDNVAEEIESVGRSEVKAVLSTIEKILRHRIYLCGWPNAPSARKWLAELRTFNRQLRNDYSQSMTRGGRGPVTDEVVREIYPDAVEYCCAHMETDTEAPLAPECPWTLQDLLAK